MEGDVQPAAHGHRVAAIVLGAAMAAAVIGPVLHEQPGDIQPLLDQGQRGNGRIHTAGNANNNTRTAHNICLKIDNGWRWPASQSEAVCQTSGLRSRAMSACSCAGVSHSACTMPTSNSCSG
ncbi:hypothetical protein D3C71_1595430 [compost metagenome]